MRFSRIRGAIAASLLWILAQGTPAPASEIYATAEAVFLQRDNESSPRPLVVNADTGQPAINANGPQFPVGTGAKLLVGYHGGGELGWEVGYLGVYGMTATSVASGPGNLDIASPLSTVGGFSGASAAQVSYGSLINSAEANLLATSERFHHPRVNAYAADAMPFAATVDWLAGFRYAGLEEQAAITLTNAGGGVGRYGVRSTSNLFGGQLGVRGRVDWDRWGIEGCGKAALAGVQLSQSQEPIFDAVTNQRFRSARGSSGATTGSILEWNVSVIRHINDAWSIRAGYMMLWLTGVGLAPDQFDFNLSTLAGTNAVGGKSLWLEGATVGLEGRW